MISPLGLALALASAAAFSAYSLLSRISVRHSADPLAFAVPYAILSGLFSLAFIPLEPWQFGTITISVILITLLATVLFGIFEASQFFARKYIEASRLTIFFQLTPVVTAFTAALFLREPLTAEKLGAIALIVLGNVVAIWKHGGAVSRAGMSFTLISVISLGLVYVADKAVFSYFPIPLYMAITYVLPGLYIAFFLKNRMERIYAEIRRTSWNLVLVAFVSALGYYLVFKTYQYADARVAIPLIYTSTIFTALGGITLLRERSNIPQKLIGVVFVFLGVVLFSRPSAPTPIPATATQTTPTLTTYHNKELGFSVNYNPALLSFEENFTVDASRAVQFCKGSGADIASGEYVAAEPHPGDTCRPPRSFAEFTATLTSRGVQTSFRTGAGTEVILVRDSIPTTDIRTGKVARSESYRVLAEIPAAQKSEKRWALDFYLVPRKGTLLCGDSACDIGEESPEGFGYCKADCPNGKDWTSILKETFSTLTFAP
jgi:drug/metabolite transporter (DMT)-like permease